MHMGVDYVKDWYSILLTAFWSQWINFFKKKMISVGERIPGVVYPKKLP